MFLHDIIKIQYSREGYLGYYPPHLISDEEMFKAFIFNKQNYFNDYYGRPDIEIPILDPNNTPGWESVTVYTIANDKMLPEIYFEMHTLDDIKVTRDCYCWFTTNSVSSLASFRTLDTTFNIDFDLQPGPKENHCWVYNVPITQGHRYIFDFTDESNPRYINTEEGFSNAVEYFNSHEDDIIESATEFEPNLGVSTDSFTRSNTDTSSIEYQIIYAHEELKEEIIYHINQYLADPKNYVIPDWVYSYMLGAAIGPLSDTLDKHDLFTMINLDNIEDEFNTKIYASLLDISSEWINKLPKEQTEHRPPTIFGEPHVIKSLRLQQIDMDVKMNVSIM